MRRSGFIIFGALALLGGRLRPDVVEIPSGAALVLIRDGAQRSIVWASESGQTWPIPVDPGPYEHVAMSRDRKWLAAAWVDADSHFHALTLELATGTVRPLLPTWKQVGDGGIDFDSQGHVVFAGYERLPFAADTTVPVERLANAAEQDVWKVSPLGGGATRLVRTADRREADLGADGLSIAWSATYMSPSNLRQEVWTAAEDGGTANPFAAGVPDLNSVHDPEASPDARWIVFSRVNSSVPPNFPNEPAANTAHDVWRTDFWQPGTPVRITQPGPISILPDLRADGAIMYTEIADPAVVGRAFNGVVVIEGGVETHRFQGMSSGKWLP